MLWETFKARAQRDRGEVADVFRYDLLPLKFRTQFVQILEEVLGNGYDSHLNRSNGSKLCQQAVEILRREFGVNSLSNAKSSVTDHNRWWIEMRGLIVGASDIEDVLSAIEILCFTIDRFTRRADFGPGDRGKIATDAINEINVRFRQNGIGFSYLDGKIIRVDSQYLHKEAVKPAIEMLHLAHFEGAKAEFLEAHHAFREGHKSKAILEAAKSFESLMKAICDKRGWIYAPTATASKLIEICMQNDLIPAFWQTNFTGLRTILESSVTTARNKMAGHGSGTTPIEIPDEMVPYVLHMTAATLLFLAERDASLP